MLETVVMERGTGKTTKAIKLLREDKELFLLVPYKSMIRFYPVDVRQRMGTVNDFTNGNLRGIKINKILIDEGFLLEKDKLAHLYYYLGQNNIDVVAYGSL